MTPAAAIGQHPVSYASRLDLRYTHEIQLVVIHCTELPDLPTAREFGERVHYQATNTGNCGHFYIDRDGQTQQWVPLDRTAHHTRGYNEHSVGIELVNSGRFPHWFDSRRQTMTEAYPDIQIGALITLLGWLSSQCDKLQWISGHEYLDRERVPASDQPKCLVQRKVDPGPEFPWPRVLKATPLVFVDQLPD